MLDRLAYHFYVLALEVLSTLYLFTYSWAGVMSFFSGLILPILHFDKPEKEQDDSQLRRGLLVFSVILFVFGTLSEFSVPWLVNTVQEMAGMSPQSLSFKSWHWAVYVTFVVGLVTHIILRRQLTPILNQIKLHLTKKSKAVREERTDVRRVKDLLPSTVKYDPEDYINLKKGVFVGLDVNKKAQYLPLEDIQKQHMDILGTTGAGKGVASSLILYQLIQAGEGVFVLDPKNDEWAPHLLRKACEDAGKPFHLINLNEPQAQLDLLANATPEQIEELLVAGFGFAEKGDVADFYRIDDRKAARKSPQKATEEERKTFKGLFESKHVQGLKDTVKAFFGKMEELSEVASINAPEGLNMQSIFDEGGCCYVIGSLRNAKIIMAQKMILIRLFQLAEMRDRVQGAPKPIAIFLDELKYHISKAAMEGLGAARDKGIHMLLAHQSVADLRDCPADLNGDAVVGAVVENTKLKLVYRIQDPETAEWVAKMSGTILVDDETRSIETDAALAEVVETRRTVKLAERHFVDTNMLLNLPPFVSYIFTTTDTPKPSLISPIKVDKETLENFEVARQRQKAEEKKKQKTLETQPQKTTDTSLSENQEEPHEPEEKIENQEIVAPQDSTSNDEEEVGFEVAGNEEELKATPQETTVNTNDNTPKNTKTLSKSASDADQEDRLSVLNF
ncbi:type IV secretion system DNA-binding domain-containing protein [Vibrio lentus]|uniref:type IV secretory system conjugative DNA transfer family protein n=1 Tax=Vibrio lentus TaxID=136468 RepID=UPI000C835DBE|nr:type IV secretion system DNA-binding domain-containing protein [Vibrio lentus]